MSEQPKGAADKSVRRKRKFARVAAVQALFQSEQANEQAETVIDQFVRHRFGVLLGKNAAEQEDLDEGRMPEADVKLFGRIVREAVLRQDVVDRAIVEALPKEWPMARLDPVLRALLRAATGELANPGGAPARVVINEYLDVAHGFFSGDEPRLVNGMLDKLAHVLRPGEFDAPVAMAVQAPVEESTMEAPAEEVPVADAPIADVPGTPPDSETAT